jgi:hypothetical protein
MPPQRSTTGELDAGRAYWKTQGMPWRMLPEIDAERQAFLAERIAIQPAIEHGIYPCKDIFMDIILNRGDVEWLLANHEQGR